MDIPVKPSCFHCQDTVMESALDLAKVLDTNSNETCYFCCPACRAISETIYQSGLSDFYQSRQNTKIGALPSTNDFLLWDRLDLQDNFVNRKNDKATATLYIEGMHCTACAWLIEKHLAQFSGLTNIRLNFQDQKLQFDYDEQNIKLSSIMSEVAAIGYTPHPYQLDKLQDIQRQESKALLKRVGISAIIMMQIGMLSLALYFGDFLGMSSEYQYLLRVGSLFFSLPLLYFSATPFIISALSALKQKTISMDVNIVLAFVGLYASSIYSVFKQQGEIYFDSVAMLLTFILLSRFFERKSRHYLMPSAPSFATVAYKITDDNSEAQTATSPSKIESCLLSDIVVGDKILIKEGGIIPLDGVVISGHSSVSEALLNGEFSPAQKNIGDTLLATSVNHDSQLIMQVSAKLEHSMIKKVEYLSKDIQGSQTSQSPWIDRISMYFTASILLLSGITGLSWHLMGNAEAFWIALSVLVVSCPCALSLAAPTARAAIQFRLRRLGLLIQKEDVLEKLLSIDSLFFDKTGSLSQGQYQIKNVHCAPEIEYDEAMYIASALECGSNHPIASAFKSNSVLADNLQVLSNLGITGDVKGQQYCIGGLELCKRWHPNAQAPDDQNEWIALCNREQVLAWFAIHDALYKDAKTAINQLQQQGFALEILSGDQSTQVDNIAAALGITQFHKGLSSQKKLDIIRNRQAQGHPSLMLGDGVNDALVLAQSDISVSFLHSCDWIKQQADMVILNQQLQSLPQAFHSARFFKRILRENFAWAFLYNFIAIPFAVMGFITPWIAALGMSISSVIVVLNSNRLFRISNKA